MAVRRFLQRTEKKDADNSSHRAAQEPVWKKPVFGKTAIHAKQEKLHRLPSQAKTPYAQSQPVQTTQMVQEAGAKIPLVPQSVQSRPKDSGTFAQKKGRINKFEKLGLITRLDPGRKLGKLVSYSGSKKSREEVIGLVTVYWFAFAVTIAGIAFLIHGDVVVTVIGVILSLGFAWIIAYSILTFLADKRAEEVENALPDVLQIIAANISAGMTPYNAIWVSARKEFGALAQEIRIAQKETLGGKQFAQALLEICDRVKSDVLRRTIRLIIQGMKTGGELPTILKGIAEDIRQIKLLQKEMAANTTTYTMFIIFGIVVGAPLLFSVSIQFVDTINKFQPDEIDIAAVGPGVLQYSVIGTQGVSMMLGTRCPKDFDGDSIPDVCEKQMGLDPRNPNDAGKIDPRSLRGETYYQEWKKSGACAAPQSCVNREYLDLFAYIALFGASFFGSLLIGMIRHGKQSAGIKLVPILVPLTILMFLLFKFGMKAFFGAMFAF